MESNQTNTQEAVDQVYGFAANMLIKENKTNYETKAALMEQGLDEESASIVVDNLEQQIAQAKKEKANKDILWGAIWCIGGIIITAVTYSAASNGGGTYVVAWGAIIFGAIQFFKGVANA